MMQRERSSLEYEGDIDTLKFWLGLKQKLVGITQENIPADMRKRKLAVEQQRAETAILGMSLSDDDVKTAMREVRELVAFVQQEDWRTKEIISSPNVSRRRFVKLLAGVGAGAAFGYLYGNEKEGAGDRPGTPEKPYDYESIPSLEKYLKNVYGFIGVYYSGYTNAGFTCAPLNEADKLCSLQGIADQVSVYPPDFFSQLGIRNLYVSGKLLNEKGDEVLGRIWEPHVFIKGTQRYSDLRETVAHEVDHAVTYAVMKKDKALDTEWSTYTRDREYIGDNFIRLKKRPQAFAGRYGKSNRGDDMATVGESLMTCDPEFLALLKDDLKLAGKAVLTLQKYRRLSPHFTDEFLQDLLDGKVKFAYWLKKH
ncbi:MAG TPA: hypothetical protein VEA59_06265 [Patescibacteria group bacterium]|nr:hypothetical protein [Patescibacteria group bacterium]